MDSTEDTQVEQEVETMPTEQVDEQVDDGDMLEDEGALIPESTMTPDEALAVLMSATPVRATCRVELEGREGMAKIQMTLRSLTDPEIKKIRKHCEIPLTREQKRLGAEPDIDEAMYSRLVVLNGVKEPRLSLPELVKHHKVANGEQLVQKLFLPGHVRLLYAEIMRLSGYSDDAVKVLGEG